MTTELKPCPFCGAVPELPDGDGTQYEIECEECGQSMASVQICDLMTIDERIADDFINYRYGEEYVERAKIEAIKAWNTRVRDSEWISVDTQKAKDIVDMMVAELPKTMGEPNIQLIYDDLKEAAKHLNNLPSPPSTKAAK